MIMFYRIIGVQYNIDKLLGNCSMSAIQNDTFDTAANLSLQLKDGSFVSRMKNPLELFYLDNSYKPAGQVSSLADVSVYYELRPLVLCMFLL